MIPNPEPSFGPALLRSIFWRSTLQRANWRYACDGRVGNSSAGIYARGNIRYQWGVVRLTHLVALVCFLIAAPQARAQQPAAVSVGTVAAALRPITQATEFVGRVEAINRVEVRARVTGYLEDVLFKDGAY